LSSISYNMGSHRTISNKWFVIRIAKDSVAAPDCRRLGGYTADGRYVMAVYEELDEVTILPVTAYEVPEP